MTQQTLTFHGMHAEHESWHAEHQTWRNDLIRWRQEYESAIYHLRKIESLLADHQVAIENHTNAIDAHETRQREHERRMEQFLHDGQAGDLQSAMADDHRRQGEAHETERMAHEDLKKRHHQRMALLALLNGAIAELREVGL